MLSDITVFLDDYNPKDIALEIAERAKQRRLQLNKTQKDLAIETGVSLGSLKRFERSGDVSLQNLLLLAVALDATETFKSVFVFGIEYTGINELLKIKKEVKRQRARKKQ
jgi:transcriptional regulator with XRE-family HTH domain